MVVSEARVETPRPQRYLAQLCKHAAAMADGAHRAQLHGDHSAGDAMDVQADWSDDSGTVVFTPGGTCEVTADGTTLTVRVEATDEHALQRIQRILTRDLERFGGREALSVSWHDVPR
jgi:uncharacterized protein